MAEASPHPVYIKYMAAHRAHMAALLMHDTADYPDDLSAAKAYRHVLELTLASNAAYIETIESGIGPHNTPTGWEA